MLQGNRPLRIINGDTSHSTAAEARLFLGTIEPMEYSYQFTSTMVPQLGPITAYGTNAEATWTKEKVEPVQFIVAPTALDRLLSNVDTQIRYAVDRVFSEHEKRRMLASRGKDKEFSELLHKLEQYRLD